MRFRPVGYYLLFLLIGLCQFTAKAQFVANGGPDKTICPGVGVPIGGAPAASGGQAPYTYSWSPSTGLSSTSLPNPTATPSTDITYTLTVTDDTNAVATDVVSVVISSILYAGAGPDTSICENSFAQLGNFWNPTGGGITYSWAPGSTLSDSGAARPTSTPTGTTSYTVTATIAGCPPKIDVVTVTVIPTPAIDAGSDTTIRQGERVTLQGSGAWSYFWSPTATLTYPSTAYPDAEPLVTTVYYLSGADASGKCWAYDSVTVFVEPNDELFFYNTFTPNGDGNNDTWYIGNINKYPENKLEIYNRNGRLLYKSNGYQNDWNGEAFGLELPAATYFYVMDPGNGMGVRNGTVTIIR